MVRDATCVHIAINRNKPSPATCRAYANQDGRWIVNLMFIDREPEVR